MLWTEINDNNKSNNAQIKPTVGQVRLPLPYITRSEAGITLNSGFDFQQQQQQLQLFLVNTLVP